ncbi:hypothetical protein AJ80_05376 [Polytolypa hystricis UAMH7299]|uniref:Ino eighty subunit 1 n=1 Tax=Polytolypa hystricis (strain UAMH7299) TaxID=1447883 RepID=A0A2B7Y3Q8_POLH7|nr:hypothetical protein AJ80_05376 [Polytolypa hystricis UAMH7299]
MASSVISVSRDITPRLEHQSSNNSTIDDPDAATGAGDDAAAAATATGSDRGAFEPEKKDHLERPDGAYYAGSRKDFPLPASRYPLPRNGVQRLLEPEPGAKGGRQRHYLDDPANSIHGYWTESGTWEDWPPKDSSADPQDQEDASAQTESRTRRSSDDAHATHANTASATVGTRRQANGTIGSVYSGNKIRHLKKDDGIPLWRKDIQFEFLKLVFEDTTPVFTRLSDGKKDCDFADIYIDAMARSSKTSKILKDKLQNDKPAAISMAMVCLLVNFGRMNTTLNFFPEMRAQLRTYHSIPSLQAHQDPYAYKQLQDAPRLKSILKGASEDTDQPNTVEKLKQLSVPRTNPVNLIFVLAQYAPKISEIHFFAPRDFFDLVMRATLSSKSRAKAFLWLMWYYLESDFSEEEALNNPFGAGLVGEGTDGLPFKVPAFEVLTEEEADAENVDTPEEIQYGEEKRIERKRILDDDDTSSRAAKRLRKSNHDYLLSDDEGLAGKGDRLSFRRANDGHDSSASTPLHPSLKIAGHDDDEELATPAPSGRNRSRRPKRDSSRQRSSIQPQRIVLKTKMDQTLDASSPAPPGAAHPVLNQFGSGSPAASHPPSSRRPRPLTQHQLAIEQHRKQRVDYELAQRRGEALKKLRTRREKETPFIRADRLLQSLPAEYDTDDEYSWGKGGICPNPEEEEDYGEAAGFYLSVMRKISRRLRRWDWDAILEDARDDTEKELKDDQKSENANGVHEADAEVASNPPASSRKPRSRGGNRRSRPSAAAAAGEADKPASKRSRPRASASGRSRAAAGDSARKPRPSARSKAAAATPTPKQEEDAGNHLTVPTPSRNMSAALSDDVALNQAEGEDILDDIDKQLLGELSGDEDNRAASTAASDAAPPPPPPPPPAAARSQSRTSRSEITSAPRHLEVSRSQDHDGESVDNNSQVLGPPDGDTESLEEEDEDVDSSMYDRNGYVGSDSSGEETEVEAGKMDEDGDETMVDA